MPSFWLERTGDLITPEQLKERWRITDEQYRRLLYMVIVKSASAYGSAPGMAVDEWWREQVRNGSGEFASASMRIKRVERGNQWWHEPSRDNYPPRPLLLEGTQEELASWLWSDSKRDRLCLRKRHNQEQSGVKRHHARQYEVWFPNQRAFEEAKSRV